MNFEQRRWTSEIEASRPARSESLKQDWLRLAADWFSLLPFRAQRDEAADEDLREEPEQKPH